MQETANPSSRVRHLEGVETQRWYSCRARVTHPRSPILKPLDIPRRSLARPAYPFAMATRPVGVNPVATKPNCGEKLGPCLVLDQAIEHLDPSPSVCTVRRMAGSPDEWPETRGDSNRSNRTVLRASTGLLAPIAQFAYQALTAT